MKNLETTITLRYWGDDTSETASDDRFRHVSEKIENGYTSGHGLDFYWEVKESDEVQVIIPADLLKEIKTALEMYGNPENWITSASGLVWNGPYAAGFTSRCLLEKMKHLE